jgi:hypothetical protein
MTFESALSVGAVYVIGCDPGPESSAFVAIEVSGQKTALVAAEYASNTGTCTTHEVFLGGTRVFDRPTFLAYEVVGAQGRFCGESTFETAAMGGEIRGRLRPVVDGIYRFIPSVWRHALTGQGNARAPLVYHEICKFFQPTGGGADPYKGTSKAPGSLWSFHKAGIGGKVEHLKDALGVALALGQVRFRSNQDPEQYRRY